MFAKPSPRNAFWALTALLMALFAPFSASAQDKAPAKANTTTAAKATDAKATGAKATGAIEVSPKQLVLSQSGDTFRGSFSIKNTGKGALIVSRVAARHSAADPRLPGGVAVKWTGKPMKLAPGASTKVEVSWNTKSARAKQLYGHVLIESNAPGVGGEPPRPVAVAIKASAGYPILGNVPILSIMTFLPLLGVILMFVAHLRRYEDDDKLRYATLAIQGVNVILAILLYMAYDAGFTKAHGNDGYQFIERVVWIKSLNVEYYVGIDGISVTMVLLTALISFVGVLASFSIDKQKKGYFAMYNLLVVGMYGTFIALDLILFFVFWEIMLLPMYFLIGIWGGPRRQYAAIKFFVYTLAGSVFMLLGFIFFYMNSDPTYLVNGDPISRSLAVTELARVAWANKGLLILGMSAVKVVWVWMFVAFAIKIPMFPFHTWLPDAHVEAPTAISVILAGVLLKMGTYGILRFNFTLLPEATRWAAPAMATFGVIGILYGAFCAMAQKDLKKLVAYSSVSHMGFTLLALGALTPQGLQACIVQMFNHGLITSMLFTLVGVVYDRVHTRDLDKFGGLAQEMPLYSAFMGFAFMASLGLPGLSGFWGEALTFIGAFPRYRALTILAATGVIVTAAYHLWAMQRMFLGKFREEWRTNKYLKEFGGKFPEINKREILTLAPLAALVLMLGFWPKPLLSLIDTGALQMHRWIDAPGPTQIADVNKAGMTGVSYALHSSKKALTKPAEVATNPADKAAATKSQLAANLKAIRPTAD